MSNKSQYRILKSHPMYGSVKKTIFRMKLDGTYDPVLRQAYMMGYIEGHEFGQTMGTIVPSDLEKAYDEYKYWLEAQIGEKPT